jgi:hypothetical protein
LGQIGESQTKNALDFTGRKACQDRVEGIQERRTGHHGIQLATVALVHEPAVVCQSLAELVDEA